MKRKKCKFTRANVDETREKVYQFICDFILENSYSPSIREIGRGLGIKSTSTISNHMRSLEIEGRIIYNKGKSRTISVPELEEKSSRAVDLPLLGTVAAGQPIFADENIERFLAMPAEFFQDDRDVFALTVKGDSMIDAAILDGDYVLVKKQNTARVNEIIVAIIGDEATVKTLIMHEGKPHLKAENEAYPLIPFYEENCFIVGVVTAVFRSLN